jgi:hypothetical protein
VSVCISAGSHPFPSRYIGLVCRVSSSFRTLFEAPVCVCAASTRTAEVERFLVAVRVQVLVAFIGDIQGFCWFYVWGCFWSDASGEVKLNTRNLAAKTAESKRPVVACLHKDSRSGVISGRVG